MFKSDITVI